MCTFALLLILYASLAAGLHVRSSRGALGESIPKIIHQTWTDDELPPLFKNWSNSWKKCLPDWEYRLHTDEDNRNYIEEHMPDFLATYEGYDTQIKRVDAAKYAYLAVDGGLYVDLDIECLHDPHRLIRLSTEGNHDAILAMDEFSHGGQLSNSMMLSASEKGRRFFKELFYLLPYTRHEQPYDSTGSVFLTSAFQDYMKRDLALDNLQERARRSDFHTHYGTSKTLSNDLAKFAVVDDSWVFNIPWYATDLKQNCTDRAWCKGRFPNATSVSHWSASYFPNHRLALTGSKVTIPKIVHQTWINHELPPEFKKWSQSWKECLPDWEYKLHTDEDNRNFIKEHFPGFLEIYDNYKEPIKRVDAARYAYMAVEGGLYADMDVECLRDPSKLLNLTAAGKYDAMLANERYSHGGQVSNAFMVATSGKGRYFFQEIMKQLPRYQNESDVVSATGPMFLTNAFKDIMVDGLAADNQAERARRTDFHTTPGSVKALSNSRTTIAMLDDSLVFNIPWFDKNHWKTACLNRTLCQEKLPEAVSVSHWTSSWSEKYSTLSTRSRGPQTGVIMPAAKPVERPLEKAQNFRALSMQPSSLRTSFGNRAELPLQRAFREMTVREKLQSLRSSQWAAVSQSSRSMSTEQTCTCVLNGLMARLPSDICRQQLSRQIDDLKGEIAPIRWAYRSLLNFYMSFCRGYES